MATILELAQRWARLLGQTVPANVFAATDTPGMQLRELFNQVGPDIRRRTSWEKTTRRVTWVSTGVEDQGSIATLCPNNYDYIVTKTFWNVTTRIPVVGPLSDADWQAIKAMVPATPLYQYRVQEGNLLVAGPVPNTNTLSLIYKTLSWLAVDATSDATLNVMTADTNVPIFPDELMLLGLNTFWRELKGLESKAIRTQYEMACIDLGGVDGVKPVIDMSHGEPKTTPGIFVPWGNWNV